MASADLACYETPSSMPDFESLDVARYDVLEALRGDAGATRRLVNALAPFVRVAVARVLFRFRRQGGGGRSVEQEIEDVAQEAFAALFENDARVLRSWDPDRGASLATFVRLVAERTAFSILRSARRSPWTEEPVDATDLDAPDSARAWPEARAATRQEAERVFARLREELNPRGYILFLRLFVEEAPMNDVCAELAMQPEAVYAWRSRFMKLVRKLSLEIATSPASDVDASRRKTHGVAEEQ